MRYFAALSMTGAGALLLNVMLSAARVVEASCILECGVLPLRRASSTQLRTALFMPAWVAGRHHRHIQAFYQKRIDAGHKPKQALVAVMRKLLHTIWGV